MSMALSASVDLGIATGGNFAMDQAEGKIHGLACAFFVAIDELDLGWWSNCTGLKIDWDFQKVNEGGVAGNSGTIPIRAKWSDVTLKRGLTRKGWQGSDGNGGVRKWLEEVIDDPTKSRTAHVTLYDAWAQNVATWSLVGVFPKSWQGPDMDADSKKVAYETLVLNHSGFLPHTTGDGAI